MNSKAQSDNEILQKSANQPWLFGIIVDRYQQAFLRKSLGILRSKEAAEDAVQETFLKIYKNAHQFSLREGASFSSWAYKILINTCYTELERRKRGALVEAYDFAELDTVRGETEENNEDRSYVESVLSRMPVGLSRFLRLYFFEDRSQKEIAQLENMSETAVRSRIHRAKKAFKNTAKELLLKTI